MTYNIFGYENKMPENTFAELYNIMEYSFPEDERRDRDEQYDIAENSAFHALTAEENGAVIGFMTFWEIAECVYIEHFAISRERRGKGLGAEMIKRFCERFRGRRIVLEAEPPALGEIAARRVEFYRRLGFFLNDFPYQQPPYRKNGQPVELKIMSFSAPLSEEQFSEIKRLLYVNVYNIEDAVCSKINPQKDALTVCFGGDFWQNNESERAGIEIPLGKEFRWADRDWIIPSVFSCEEGLVVDFCMRVSTEKIRDFKEKWGIGEDCVLHEKFASEQLETIYYDNPMNLNFNAKIELNGQILHAKQSCSISFSPSPSERAEPEIMRIIEYYGLDKSFAWVVHRHAFPWQTASPEIRSLSVALEQEPERVSGTHFTVHDKNETVNFTHPVSGKKYTLTVLNLEQKSLRESDFGEENLAYPTHFTAMSYTISPQTDEKITVCDCAENEKPRAIGQVGGFSTVVVLGENTRENCRTACSALRFKPVEGDIEWKIAFDVKRFEDKNISLITDGMYDEK